MQHGDGVTLPQAGAVKAAKPNVMKRIIRDRALYLLALPGILFFIIFKYGPMWGLIIAFQKYSPYKGMLKSDWVGFEHFIRFFTEEAFFQILRNTLSISILNLIFFFPVPIVLAILLNEVTSRWFKRVTQTVIYFPHFLSWVIIYGLTYILLNQTDGVVNQLIRYFGAEESIPFMMKESLFYPLIVLQNIWRDAGWGTIIFLAALTGIDPALYEAARMDGAGRFRQIWHITLPGIRNVITVLLILRIGHMLDVGFEHIFLMTNAAVSDLAEIIDTYVYRNGILNGQFSYSAAVGLFNSIVGTILVIGANSLSKKLGQDGLY
jgi:putative aldouronate transport system permease protein